MAGDFVLVELVLDLVPLCSEAALDLTVWGSFGISTEGDGKLTVSSCSYQTKIAKYIYIPHCHVFYTIIWSLTPNLSDS